MTWLLGRMVYSSFDLRPNVKFLAILVKLNIVANTCGSPIDTHTPPRYMPSIHSTPDSSGVLCF